MAEQIPYAVAASLIDRLASAAFRELGRVYGVMDELKRLKSIVESIKAVLLDAEERQERDHAVQLWITRLKGVLYPAEDLLDEFAIEDMRHKLDSAGSKNKVKEVFHFLSPRRLGFRRDMAHKIEKVRNSFINVVQEMSRLNLSPRIVLVEETDRVRRETASFVLESDIIGREDSKKEIINLLRQPNKSQNISLVAIVGIGGLGKTALAQLVYNDVEVQNVFEKQMWVCISVNFDVKSILKSMLESLTKSKIDDKLSLDTLQNRLHENLRGRKYLLVLDDTWNESHEKWTQLRSYLMCGAQNSKVLVTTRSKIVAQIMGVNAPYVLNGLTREESWSLLKNIAFGDDIIGMNQNLKSIGKKIAEKCRGVPLAIRTMGGLLHGKSEKSEWMDILQGNWTLCEDEDSIIPVLKLSYQNLSPQMRQCFAYCSLYPKDWVIKKNELIELWMAQGYLECTGEKQLMEDVGNQFIKIFLMKSFFQDAKMTEHGDIDCFKMHDLVHDLAIQVAGNDCCCLDSGAKSLVGRPMHVWLAPDALGLLDSLDASKLRTLVLLASELNEKELAAVSSFKYLRALSLWSPSRKLPDSVGIWMHLRYLRLPQSSGVETLPKSISNLVCLQTLRLGDCYKLEFPKNDVSKLISLRHLNTFYDYYYTIQFEEIYTFTNLGCSRWLSSLTNIVEISLQNGKYGRNIPPLEHLPFLKSLVMDSLYELEYIYFDKGSRPGGTFFPSLERLSFTKCIRLRGWCKMGEDFNDTNDSLHLSFPRLSHLSIQNCERLTSMPTFPNLDKSLTLVSCPMEPLGAALQNVAAVEFTPLSMLNYLCIDGSAPDMIKLPKDWMKNMSSLQYLKLNEFSGQAFQEMEVCFEDEICCFPSLRKLVISFSRDLEALPDWICNISLLQHIKIEYCNNLASLPEGMFRLTSLQTLEICYCGLLVGKCQSETSATSHKIAHIPNIILKERPEQEIDWVVVGARGYSSAALVVIPHLE